MEGHYLEVVSISWCPTFNIFLSLLHPNIMFHDYKFPYFIVHLSISHIPSLVFAKFVFRQQPSVTRYEITSTLFVVVEVLSLVGDVGKVSSGLLSSVTCFQPSKRQKDTNQYCDVRAVSHSCNVSKVYGPKLFQFKVYLTCMSSMRFI